MPAGSAAMGSELYFHRESKVAGAGQRVPREVSKHPRKALFPDRVREIQEIQKAVYAKKPGNDDFLVCDGMGNPSSAMVQNRGDRAD